MKKQKRKWYKSISNWLFIVIFTILGLFLTMNISIMIQAKKNENVVPSVFGIKPFIVLSGSMESQIHKGDLIFTKKVEPDTLKKGDIIAFRDSKNTVTTHRIIDVTVEEGVTYFITKGDNNASQDLNLVEFEDVEGVYIGRMPGIGSIMNSLSEPSVLIIVILGITVIFVIGFSISTRNQRELERQEFLEYKKMKAKEEKKKVKETEVENDDADKEVKEDTSSKKSKKKS